MNVADVGRALWRHPVWLVLGIVVAVVAGGATFSVVAPEQQSTASVVILPPAYGDDVTSQNPFLNLDNTLAQLATLVGSALTSGAGKEALDAAGATGAFTIANTTSDNPSFAQLSPELVFTVTDPDAGRARFTAEQLVAGAATQLTALQARAKVPAAARATVVTVSEPSAATVAGDGQIRAGGGVGLIVLVLVAAMIVLLDAGSTRRRRRKQLAADVRRPRIERPSATTDTADRDRTRRGPDRCPRSRRRRPPTAHHHARDHARGRRGRSHRVPPGRDPAELHRPVHRSRPEPGATDRAGADGRVGLTRLRGGRGVLMLFAWRVACGVYLLAGVAAYVAGMSQGLASDVIAQSDRALITRVAVVGFAVLVVEVVRTRRHLEVVVGTVVAAGVVSALAGLAQFATGVDVGGLLKLPGLQSNGLGLGPTALREGYARASGSASVPLEYGAVMTVIVPLAVTMFLLARRRGERAWPWAVATLLLVAAGGVSLSRSVFVGIAVTFVVLAVGWSLRRTGAVLLAALGGAAVAWFAAGGVVTDLVGLVTQGTQDYSLQSRTDGRSYVLRQVLQHTWFGQGLGTYQTGVQPVLDNQYLSELIESGLIGVAALIAVLVTTFVVTSRARVLDPDPDGRDLAAGLSASLAVVATVDLVLDTAGFAQILLLGWLIIGLCGAATHLGLVSHRQFGGRDEVDRRIGDRPAPA